MSKRMLNFVGAFLVFSIAVVWYKFSKKDELFTVMEVPEFSLTDQNGKTITRNSMLGKVYVVEFFFTSCPTICPVMSMNLRSIEDEIQHPDFGILSITIDPKRDTPQRLAEYARKIGVKSKNWHHLTGDRADIQTLSKEFNIYVEDVSQATGLDHSGKFALVDKNGKIRSRYLPNGLPMLYYSGLNYLDPEGKKPSLQGEYHPEVELLIEDIRKLLNEQP
ncbi:SCO family protein [Vaginella massiliensis]|uniref:SCO family protein n=1 Tax=Vaginella massiliensis TaxID=1816680 RepID=UPI0037512AA1